MISNAVQASNKVSRLPAVTASNPTLVKINITAQNDQLDSSPISIFVVRSDGMDPTLGTSGPIYLSSILSWLRIQSGALTELGDRSNDYRKR